MITESRTTNVASIEEYTLFGLDRSDEGLKTLSEEARACVGSLQGDAAGYARVVDLTQKLHDFDMFEMNVCALFQVDRSSCGDAQGSLDEAMCTYREALVNLGESLSASNLDEAVRIIVQDIDRALNRVRQLVPVLREKIKHEYLAA